MLGAKTVLDEVQDRRAFDDARNRANPFEGVRKEFFINRAAAKMAAIDAAFGWIFSYADAQDPAHEGAAASAPLDAPFGTAPRPAPSLLHFGDVAAGPGGFSEYLLWRRGCSACGVGFTLRGDHDFTLHRFHHKARARSRTTRTRTRTRTRTLTRTRTRTLTRTLTRSRTQSAWTRASAASVSRPRSASVACAMRRTCATSSTWRGCTACPWWPDPHANPSPSP